ncbi:MAG: glutathione synthase [Planctomycetota bacterium]|mgnify:CR=1 FL=1|nr:MAG: glutathione synthase [Planctomycetota bacterium]REJ90908.1 MAG: glutathione synthase [Planctomycetota bacterium]REK17685.1 MAG: glutathione synthase [Planctomycetota bacterium]REK46738.1 MAG: glutathione synthase [Planctomycetota bacterium]
MRIGFVVNDIATEQPEYTTTRLAMAAHNRGHESWLIGTGDIAYDKDEHIRARGRRASKTSYKATSTYLQDLRGARGISERITVDDLDVLMLRNDPAEDKGRRAWAQTAGIVFGRVALRHGVIVLNDPNGLAKAINKMYFQLFPEEVRPQTLITRDRDDIKAFARDVGDIVIKPLQGSGGTGVFLVRRNDLGNLNQMVESISRDGYIVAQEYLPAAAEGDMRLFMMNGAPLRHRGKYAAFRRLRSGDDIRSNIHAGGKKASAVVDESALRIAEIVRPKLVEDGMFLVGLDIVGDKLMEINVFSPGGLGSAQKFEGVTFSPAVIAALERKVQYMSFYRRNFNNVDMATL